MSARSHWPSWSPVRSNQIHSKPVCVRNAFAPRSHDSCYKHQIHIESYRYIHIWYIMICIYIYTYYYIHIYSIYIVYIYSRYIYSIYIYSIYSIYIYICVNILLCSDGVMCASTLWVFGHQALRLLRAGHWGRRKGRTRILYITVIWFNMHMYMPIYDM